MSIGAAGCIGLFHDADCRQRALDMLRRLQEEKARVPEGSGMYLAMQDGASVPIGVRGMPVLAHVPS